MTELLKLLQEVVGARPLLPLVLLILAGYLFKAIRNYPLKELFYDRWYLITDLVIVSIFVGYSILASGPKQLLHVRWYLITALVIVSTFVGYVIFTSSLADRTPEGRFGIYVARFHGDSDRSLHVGVAESLLANLDHNARTEGIRIEVRDLKKEINDQDIDRLDELARHINAATVVWGTAVHKNRVYLRLWSQGAGLVRASKPVNVGDISDLSNFAGQVWITIHQTQEERARLSAEAPESQIKGELARLRNEVTELRQVLNSALLIAGKTAGSSPSALTSILVGVGRYQGNIPPLLSPENDVVAMREALLARNPSWSVTALLNSEATKNQIEQTIYSASRLTPHEVPLLIYLTGRSEPMPGGGHYFFSYDSSESLATAVDLENLITQTLHQHPLSIFIVDGRFDPMRIDRNIVKEAAILTAESTGYAYETHINGRVQGAFTAALVEIISRVPAAVPLTVNNLYVALRASTGQQFRGTEPRLQVGPNASAL